MIVDHEAIGVTIAQMLWSMRAINATYCSRCCLWRDKEFSDWNENF